MSNWKCYFNIHLLQHNIVWACGSDILIYIYYNAMLCDHVDVLFWWTFIATQYCVSMWKCYFNIYLLQHHIVWAYGSVILIYIYYNTMLCEHVEVLFNTNLLQHNIVWTCGSVILIYIYYNTILCGGVILIYIYYNTILCEHV